MQTGTTDAYNRHSQTQTHGHSRYDITQHATPHKRHDRIATPASPHLSLPLSLSHTSFASPLSASFYAALYAAFQLSHAYHSLASHISQHMHAARALRRLHPSRVICMCVLNWRLSHARSMLEQQHDVCDKTVSTLTHTHSFTTQH